MGGFNLGVVLVAGAVGLWIQYVIIKTAVYQGLLRFLTEASRVSDMREGYDVPRRVDRLAEHLAEIIRRPPEDGDPPRETTD